MYEEDLQPLNDVLDIVFSLTLSIDILKLFEKYRADFNKNPNFKQEMIELSKNNIDIILSNFSDNYKSNILGKYFSPNGIVLYIINELINKSFKYYMEVLDSVNSER